MTSLFDRLGAKPSCPARLLLAFEYVMTRKRKLGQSNNVGRKQHQSCENRINCMFGKIVNYSRENVKGYSALAWSLWTRFLRAAVGILSDGLLIWSSLGPLENVNRYPSPPSLGSRFDRSLWPFSRGRKLHRTRSFVHKKGIVPASMTEAKLIDFSSRIGRWRKPRTEGPNWE